jgi:hypothetical protein
MKILVVSKTPWNNDNSFGNTYSSLFEDMENVEFANVYCSFGYPKNNIKGSYFQINEKTLIQNLVNPKRRTGRIIDEVDSHVELNNKEMKIINNVKKNRSRVFFWARRLIWWIGRWKSVELKDFVNDFKPDIIFVPLYHSTYLNQIMLYIKKISNVKMVTYVSDDVYTLKQFSISPFYWLDRLATRRMIKKVVNQCEYIYVISDIQKEEYEKCFNKDCRILTKGADFSNKKPILKNASMPLKLVYTGNIGGGRWKSLSNIAKALEKMNRTDKKAEIYVYTMTPISKKMEKALTIKDTVYLMGGVPFEKIPEIQNNADILIHVESMKLKEKLVVRHSFSTKLVDYFYRSRCIFAVGPQGIASIDYLKNNDSALVAIDKSSIEEKIKSIIENPFLIDEYAQKAWDCGKRHHEIKDIQHRLLNDLNTLIEENENENLTN